MLASLLTNFVISLVMLTPLLITGIVSQNLLFYFHLFNHSTFIGININERHNFLQGLLEYTHPEEDLSFNRINIILPLVSGCVGIFSLLEMVMYFLYNEKVKTKYKSRNIEKT